jgi:hypothetical protein
MTPTLFPDPRSASPPWLLPVLLAAAAAGFVALTLYMGKEAAWDFQNYHWYNPFALLHGRIGFDVAVGHHATYYNPVLDLPLWLLASGGPAWIGGVWLGLTAGLAAILLGAIAWTVLPVPFLSPTRRLLLAAFLGAIGMFGGGTLGQIGSTSNDILAALPLLAGWLVLLRGSELQRPRTMLLAGLLVGLAVGFKLTMILYAVGSAVALVALPGSLQQRLRSVFWFGLGGVAGVLLGGGWWMAMLYAGTGNPVFPFANTLFKSPLILDADYSDPTFRPHGLWTKLFFPFIFTADTRRVAEWDFRDVRLALVYTLSFVVFAVWAIRRLRPARPAAAVEDDLHARSLIAAAPLRVLLTAIGATYLVWVLLFGIYRYVLPLEMLAPTLIAALLALLPVSRRLVVAAAVAVPLVTQLFVIVGVERLSWRGGYVEATLPPLEADAMVLGTGHYPFSYLIPYAPPTVPFLRIHGWLVGPDVETGMTRAMRERVAAHRGPLYVIAAPFEFLMRDKALDLYGLTMGTCAQTKSNIGPALQICRLTRRETP